MNRLGLQLFALPVALLAAGCVDDEFTLEFIQNQQVTAPVCVPVTAAAGAGQTAGTLDVGIVEGGAGSYAGYIVYPIVKNNLVDPALENNPPGLSTIVSRTDIQLIGGDVEYVASGALAAALPTNQRSFFQPAAAGSVAMNATGTIAIEVMPVQVATELGAAVAENAPMPMIVRFRVVGTHAGTTSTTGWVEYPMKLCRWCLTGGKPLACPKGGFLKSQVSTGNCNIAQDTQVTCCINSANHLRCGNDVPFSTTGM